MSSFSVGSPAAYQGQKTITTPADQQATNPLETTIDLGDVWLVSVDYYIPSGNSGALAWQLLYSGTPLVPWGDSTQWQYGDNIERTVSLGTEIPGAMLLKTVNTGFFQHVLYLRFNYTPMSAYSVAPSSPTIVPIS